MLYISNFGAFNEVSGVSKKILAQVKVYSKRIEECFCSDHRLGIACLWNDNGIVEKKIAISDKDYYRACIEWVNKSNSRYVYIRHRVPVTYWYIDMLKELKEMGVRIAIDFPTFPYDESLNNTNGLTILREDKMFRSELCKYVDFGVTYNDVTNIFNIPVIQLQNGVDIVDNKIREAKKKGNKIVLLSVSSGLDVHGYERILQGMYEYKAFHNDYEIVFVVVGEGPEMEFYKKLVDEYKLNSFVDFRGFCIGNKLEECYKEADLGVGTLGFYKIGMNEGAPIKTREYCARGLPFIYGYRDLGFSGDENYVLNVPNNDEPVNMEEVIRLYERTVGRQDIIDEMREFVRKNCTWDVLLEPVISYFKNNQ